MKKNIVFFIPSIEGGGVEKNFFLLVKYLSKEYHKIFVISADRKFPQYSKGIVQINPSFKFSSKNKRFFKTLFCLYLLIKNFAFKKTTILSFQSNISIIIVSKIFGFKIIARLNTSLKKYINKFWKKFIFKFIYSKADKIIVNSKNFQKELDAINLKSNLIYNLVEMKKVKKKINFFNKFDGLKILNIGRLTHQKDQITLIRCLNLLKIKKVKFKCVIIGRGILRDYLKKKIIKYNLEKEVLLAGYKKDAENYISNCNIFVLTSKYEGLPNVLIEAQKYNIPIISSNCPTGPSEILLGGKLGVLFKVGDFRMLTNKLLDFNKNKINLKKKSKLAKNYLFRFDPVSKSLNYRNLIDNA